MNLKQFSLITALFFVFQLNAQQSLQNLKSEINKLKQESSLKHASWSVCIMDGKTGKILTSFNKEQSLIPASCMKIVSTAPTLSILGSDFRFQTKLQYDGLIDSNGTLHGNIYIKGGGDPSLGSSRWENNNLNSVFQKWSDAIKEKGIERINGNIIGDASIFELGLIPGSWSWDDIGNYYGAGASGLTINENYYKIVLKPGTKLGSPTKVLSTNPYLSGVKFINHVKTGAKNSGDNVIIYGSPYSNIKYLKGTIPLGVKQFTVKGSMSDPAFYCAFLFNNFLVAQKIKTNNNPTTLRILKENKKHKTTSRQTFYVHKSPKLSSIIKLTNQRSINSYAEACLRMCGVKMYKKGSTKKGIEAITNFWVSKGVPKNGLKINDGSGLSRSNLITTQQITQMLYAYTKEANFQEFYNSFAVAGKSGSIRNLFKGTSAENNLRAKSGYMSGIRAYSGYVDNSQNKRIIYSIIINNYSGSPYAMKKKLEKLMIKIAEL